jgi:RNA polymerase sigma factor for flagellar operon FliA
MAKRTPLTNAQIAKLLGDMQRAKDPAISRRILNRIAEHCFPMILSVATHFHQKTRCRGDFDAMLSDGLYGLHSAMLSFDPARETKFTSYAQGRIRGSIVDGLRDVDFLPRLVRARKKQVDRILSRHMLESGVAPTCEQLVKELGPEADKIVRDSRGGVVLSMETEEGEYNEAGHDHIQDPRPGPDFDLATRIRILCMGFTETERMIFIGHYYKRMPMAAIARMLDCSESRISQICTGMLQRIKEDQRKVECLRDAVA